MKQYMTCAGTRSDTGPSGHDDLRRGSFEVLAVLTAVLFAAMLVSAIIVFRFSPVS